MTDTIGNRPRCACGYLAASHEGLRWHWEQKVCPWGGPSDRVSWEDMGQEPGYGGHYVERWEDITLWRFNWGPEEIGDWEDPEEAIVELSTRISEAVRLHDQIPLIRFYSVAGKRRLPPELVVVP